MCGHPQVEADAAAVSALAQALAQVSLSASASHADVSGLATPVPQGQDQDLAVGQDESLLGPSTPFNGGAGAGLGAGAGASAGSSALLGGPLPMKAHMVRSTSGTGGDGGAGDGLSRWNAERGMSAIIERMDLLKADLMVRMSSCSCCCCCHGAVMFSAPFPARSPPLLRLLAITSWPKQQLAGYFAPRMIFLCLCCCRSSRSAWHPRPKRKRRRAARRVTLHLP